MKQSLRFAVAAAAMGMAATASAGYFEIGTELESFNSDYSSSDMVLPYMAVGGNPIEGTPFSAELKTSYRQRNESAARGGNRYRQDITVGYSWDFGDFVFAPRYRLRQDFMNSGSRTYEHRFFPNMSYRLNDTFSLQLDGFVAPVQQKRVSARGEDAANGETIGNYTDYKQEFDVRLHTQLSETQRLTVSVFNEYSKNSKMTSAQDGQDQLSASEWQLRVVYSQNFGDFSLTPFARFGLSNKSERVNKEKFDQNRHRFGLAGTYRLSSDLSLVGETYYQTQNQQGFIGDTTQVEDRNDRNMMFYKLGVRYSF